MTQEQANELLAREFENCVTEAEEAVLDKLEAEWLMMCRANELEAYDYYSMSKAVKGKRA